ncbi:zinc finger protein 771-like isoform X2 [Nerophis ophidion]|uniref:zinc finger protein 771-like isoform X2 n=1 Tax=Nerophis ophidion TaxID=159077 RepID=UPI002AE03904|nr:zinc finger protein 771-like isoform X2 [Nerophis ophidion]
MYFFNRFPNSKWVNFGKLNALLFIGLVAMTSERDATEVTHPPYSFSHYKHRVSALLFSVFSTIFWNLGDIMPRRCVVGGCNNTNREGFKLHHWQEICRQTPIECTKVSAYFTGNAKTDMAQRCMDNLQMHLQRLSQRNHEDKTMNGRQGEAPPRLRAGSSTTRQEDPQSPHVKNEEDGHRSTQGEAELSKFPLTVVSGKTVDRGDKAPESSQRHHSPRDCPTRSLEGSTTLKPPEPQPPNLKEEEDEVWITQVGPCLLGQEKADLTKFPLTVVSVKTEDHGDKPPESSQLHHSPSEENRAVEPSRRKSNQHMTTEAGEDHCGGSQADKLLAPLSDSEDTTSHSPEDEDRDDTQEPLSSDADCEGDARTQTDDEHSKCAKKRTRKKRLICSVCAKRFSFKCELTQHMKTHTGEKPFSCLVCGDKFAQRPTLTRHMRTHSGEKPFSCSVCADKFALRSTLSAHMRTHTGEKPFSCSICGERFTQKGTIAVHMRRHTGTKPYSCTVCGKSFSQKGSIALHMRTHTGEKTLYLFNLWYKILQQLKHAVTHENTHVRETISMLRLR